MCSDVLAHDPAIASAWPSRSPPSTATCPRRLAIECPACGRAADVPFAIATFLWREVDAWARRTLREVHALARAYGWSEARDPRAQRRRAGAATSSWPPRPERRHERSPDRISPPWRGARSRRCSRDCRRPTKRCRRRRTTRRRARTSSTRVPAASAPPLATRTHARPPTPRRASVATRPPLSRPRCGAPRRRRAIRPITARDTAPAAASRRPTSPRRTAQLASTAAPARVPAAAAPTAQATAARVPAASVAPREARRPRRRARSSPRLARSFRRFAASRPSRRGERPADAREQPAPEIRISIGRIEVRATAAERPPARRQPSRRRR